ncbi:alkaline phosphatase-like protein [Rhizophagus clarus]|uniref:alkaline phosphatase n=1 Tax=Rhizophagus clarus TaxID=94130 RepID=A0A8H3MJ33_9GLOM|nr:alkaline phosphatase-like protein [Rhizophagus clarus]
METRRNGTLLGFGSERKKTRRELCTIIFAAVIVMSAVIVIVSVWASLSSGANSYEKRSVILMISDGFGPASETFAHHQIVLSPISAAGATAFACAMKSYNRAIAVNPEKVPCGTVLESAKHFGFATGLVVTSRITHATPATFSAHVVDRDMESDIAVQANCTEGSCRIDERDLVKESKKRGFKYLSTRKEFDELEPGKDDICHMEIDRDPTKEPSLKEMSEKALKFLESATADSDKGFFLMIEGNMAAHSNDAAAHVHDILAYHETIDLVKKYVDEHPGTVMISVSDHETGGFSLARQVSNQPQYLWYPEYVSRIEDLDDYDVNWLGENRTQLEYEYYLVNITNFKAQLGWATHGHSAVDVNLYAYGQGKVYCKYLDLDLNYVTNKLNSNNVTFHQAFDSTHFHNDEHHHH